MTRNVFITGGTGYIGSRLVKALVQAGDCHIKALVRKGSEQKIPPGCEIVFGNALQADTYQDHIEPSSVFIHLIGVSHPSPSKKEMFHSIDAVSVKEAARAAKHARCVHFIYLSVAQYPNNLMKEYQAVRAEGEKMLADTGIDCSFVRPWYVLGPGHWWPLLLKPLYWVAQLVPPLREGAKKLDTVTITQMINTLVHAVLHPPLYGCAFYEVSDIKKM